jgi:translation initiation factor 2 gamma subunit (eIF-2gamma)
MSKIKELYEQIEKELETCDASETPVICSNLGDDQNRACIIQTIAETSLSMKLDITQAIIQVEKSFSLNDID